MKTTYKSQRARDRSNGGQKYAGGRQYDVHVYTQVERFFMADVYRQSGALSDGLRSVRVGGYP